MPQKNHPTTVSPIKEAKPKRKIKNRKKEHRKRNSKSYGDEDEDFTVTTGETHKRGYIKYCIKKRLNNNYVKQINCIQDENVIFTDNKIYVSLAARNSVTSSNNNSLKKNRRVIYPTSDGYKTKGFLRDYDFNYESPARTTSGMTTPDSEDTLKFNMMTTTCSLNSVVFEKVKVASSKKSNKHEIRLLNVTATNFNEKRSFGSPIEKHQFDINSYEGDDEDDVQWKNFLELRKHGKSMDSEHVYSQKMPLSDSGFGSQLFPVDKNLKSSEVYLDDETFDNIFNEELEKRVSIIFPDLCKSNSQTAFYSLNNNEYNAKKEKFS